MSDGSLLDSSASPFDSPTGHPAAASPIDPTGAVAVGSTPDTDRSTLPRRLRELATDVDSPAWSQLLRRLADAIDNGKELHLWASMSLFELFGDAADLVAPPEPKRWQRLLMGAPAVLVFLPIVITWMGLAAATSAYRAALAKDPELVGRSFLEMWQTGMAGELSPAFTFDRAAMYTLTGLLVLVMSVIVSGLLRQQHRASVASYDLELNQRLHGLLAESSLVLAEERLTAPDRLTMEFNLAAQELRAIQAEAKKIQQAASKSATSASHAADSAAAASTALVEAVIRLDASVVDVSRGVQDSREATAAHAAEASRTSQAAALAVSTAVAAAVADSVAASKSVAQVHDELKQIIRTMDQQFARAVADGVSTGVAPIAAAAGDLSTSTSELGRVAGQALMDAQKVVTSQRTAVEDANARLEDVVRRVDQDFSQSVHQLAASMQGQVSSYEAAIDAAGHISASFAALQRTLESVSRDLQAMGAKLDEERRLMKSLASRDAQQ